MKKQLIVVVHGVGVREAGISTDLLSTALEDDPPLVQDEIRDGAAQGMPKAPVDAPPKEIDWRPHSSDDFHLRELPKYGQNDKRAIFAARVRRYRNYDPATPSEVRRERVVADFYWGDISATGNDVLRLIVGFFKIVLGLSHAVRENARAVFDQDTASDRFFRRLASMAALTIHGPIFAINLVLLGGLILARMLRFLRDAVSAPDTLFRLDRIGDVAVPIDQTVLFAVIAAIACLVAGWWIIRHGHAYLMRLLGGWMLVAALVMAGFAVIDWASDGKALFAFDDSLRQMNCNWSPDQVYEDHAIKNAAQIHRECRFGYQGPILYGARFQGLMVVAWSFVMASAVVLGVAAAFRQRGRRPARPVSLVMPALGLMMLMWFLLFGALWSTILKLPLDWNMNSTHVSSALRALGPAVIALALLIAAAVWRHVRKVHELAQLSPPMDYMAKAEVLAERHRLLIARPLLIILNLFVVAVLILSVDGALRGIGWGQILPDVLPRFLQVNASWFMGGLGLVAALLVGFARRAFALGIAIATDVLVYINDYSWTTATAAADDAPGYRPMWFERLPGLTPRTRDDDMLPHGYWPRQRIQDRLKVLVAQLIRDEAPDEIIIVAHSQGTVIALDVVAEMGPRWTDRAGGERVLGLVTMGSPYTHLYATYFSKGFPPHRDRAGLRPRDGDGPLHFWTNIFRVDDFVGTHITASTAPPDGPWPERQWPREKPVPENGHTMYWTDENVAAILRPLLEAD